MNLITKFLLILTIILFMFNITYSNDSNNKSKDNDKSKTIDENLLKKSDTDKTDTNKKANRSFVKIKTDLVFKLSNDLVAYPSNSYIIENIKNNLKKVYSDTLPKENPEVKTTRITAWLFLWKTLGQIIKSYKSAYKSRVLITFKKHEPSFIEILFMYWKRMHKLYPNLDENLLTKDVLKMLQSYYPDLNAKILTYSQFIGNSQDYNIDREFISMWDINYKITDNLSEHFTSNNIKHIHKYFELLKRYSNKNDKKAFVDNLLIEEIELIQNYINARSILSKKDKLKLLLDILVYTSSNEINYGLDLKLFRNENNQDIDRNIITIVKAYNMLLEAKKQVKINKKISYLIEAHIFHYYIVYLVNNYKEKCGFDKVLNQFKLDDLLDEKFKESKYRKDYNTFIRLSNIPHIKSFEYILYKFIKAFENYNNIYIDNITNYPSLKRNTDYSEYYNRINNDIEKLKKINESFIDYAFKVEIDEKTINTILKDCNTILNDKYDINKAYNVKKSTLKASKYELFKAPYTSATKDEIIELKEDIKLLLNQINIYTSTLEKLKLQKNFEKYCPNYLIYEKFANPKKNIIEISKQLQESIKKSITIEDIYEKEIADYFLLRFLNQYRYISNDLVNSEEINNIEIKKRIEELYVSYLQYNMLDWIKIKLAKYSPLSLSLSLKGLPISYSKAEYQTKTLINKMINLLFFYTQNDYPIYDTNSIYTDILGKIQKLPTLIKASSKMKTNDTLTYYRIIGELIKNGYLSLLPVTKPDYDKNFLY